MRVNLSKKEFYKKIVFYFKLELENGLYSQYSEGNNAGCQYFVIKVGYGLTSFCLRYFEETDKLFCQILSEFKFNNGVKYVIGEDIDTILDLLVKIEYFHFNINYFNILVKCKLI